MTVPSLGILKNVDLRTAWADEALSFTPWLAAPENMSLLGEAIGTQLSCEGTEIPVGPFAADILAQDELGRRVLIENQLETTDHRHLGQCLTYAAGLDVNTVIWICRKVREEHRAAIDWLNAITQDDIDFLAIEIELYQIGDSEYAPRFNIVAKPNHWSRQVSEKARTASAALTETQKEHIAYWESVIALAEGIYPALARRKPFKGNWQTAETLSFGANLQIGINGTRSREGLRAEIYLAGDHAKSAFDWLRERILDDGVFDDLSVDWERLDRGRDSRIAIYMDKQDTLTSADEDGQKRFLVAVLLRCAEFCRSVQSELRTLLDASTMPSNG